MEPIAEVLLKKGEAFYNWGRLVIKRFLPAGFGVIALIMLVSQIGWSYWGTDYFALRGTYDFVNFLMLLAYLAILIGLIGIPFYFYGLHYMGLGQIAKNTAPKE